MTRVAWLDPNMWSELLLDNRDNLLRELDFYLGSLAEYGIETKESAGLPAQSLRAVPVGPGRRAARTRTGRRTPAWRSG